MGAGVGSPLVAFYGGDEEEGLARGEGVEMGGGAASGVFFDQEDEVVGFGWGEVRDFNT